MGSLIKFDMLETWRKKLDEGNARIVLTNGCYDILHIGHLRTFQQAKAFGDVLVVGVNSDASVRALKGKERPINPEDARSELVAALEPVDFVTLFSDFTADNLLELIRPHVYVKGGDYSQENLPERETLSRLGIEVKLIPLVEGFSTTTLIRKLNGLI